LTRRRPGGGQRRLGRDAGSRGTTPVGPVRAADERRRGNQHCDSHHNRKPRNHAHISL
jgi:hypothetical protein